MKLIPRAGDERGSIVAPVLGAGESRRGSGLLRERSWHGRTLPMPLPFSSGRFPRCPGGQGQPRPPCLLSPRGVWVTGLLSPHLHSCHLPQPAPRREERVWLCSLWGSAAAFPRLLKMTMVGGDGGGSSGQEVPGAAAQPSPARRGLVGCLAGCWPCSGIGSDCRQRMSPAEGKTKAASKDRGTEFGKDPKDTN